MGDGRYYTYYQFVDVLIAMLISVLAVASILFFYYRKNKDMDIKYITIPSALVIVFLVLRLIESVVPNLILSENLRELQLVLLLISSILCTISNSTFPA